MFETFKTSLQLILCYLVFGVVDTDFANRKAAKAGGPQVVWVRIGNCSNKALTHWFVPLLPTIAKRLEDGEAIIELI